MEKFAELVKEKSGGKIKVRLFPGGALGGDVQTVSALQGGTIEMSVMNAGLLSGGVEGVRAGRSSLPVRQRRSRPMRSWTARSAPSWRKSCPRRASLVWAIGSWASAT